MREDRTQSRAAFTLIELLVVVSIISILAALLLPALAQGKARARSAACKSKLRQIALALRMYCDDTGHYPFLFFSADDDPNERSPSYWPAFLSPYYSIPWTNLSYHCPEYKTVIVNGSGQNRLRGSYSYNGWGAFASWDSTLGLGSEHTRENPKPAVSEGQVVVPSRMYAIADSRILEQSPAGPPGGAPVMWGEAGYPEAASSLSGRHAKGYNVAFCDDHVELVKRRDLTNAPSTARFFNIDNQDHPELRPPPQ